MSDTVYPDDWSEEDIKKYKDTVSTIVAGMDQVRSGLGISWRELSWKRMQELAERIAMLAWDFSVFDAELVGRYILASSRTQVEQMELMGSPEAGAVAFNPEAGHQPEDLGN